MSATVEWRVESTSVGSYCQHSGTQLTADEANQRCVWRPSTYNRQWRWCTETDLGILDWRVEPKM